MATVVMDTVTNSDAGIYDRVVVMELLKQVAQTHCIDTSHRQFKGQCERSGKI